jgi:hypothetical protein
MARITSAALVESKTALKVRDLDRALAICNKENSRDRGVNDEATARKIELILDRTPTVLSDYPSGIMDSLRVATAMMELWGENVLLNEAMTPEALDQQVDPETVVHLLHSHASYLYSIERCRSLGITKVRVIGSPDEDNCDACIAVLDKVFALDQVPELPLADCGCRTIYGCRLFIGAEL